MQDWKKLISEKMQDWHIKPSPPDERDWPLQTILRIPEKIPKVASLEHYFPYIMDQKQNPYCGGYAGVGIANSYYNSIGQLPAGGFSPSWLYWQAKEIDGLPGQDGTTLRAILQVMHKTGLCTEALCPTLPGNSKPVFTSAMYKGAERYKIKAYARLNVGTLREIQEAIANGRMVLIGSMVTSTNWADGWIVQPEGNIAGGHATVHLAYDQGLQYERNGQAYTNFCRGANSWGQEWGLEGFYQMAEHYANFTFVDFGGMPALMEAWAVEFDVPMQPRTPITRKGRFDIAPTIIDGRTVVELRSLANLAGVQDIAWDEATKKVTLTYPDKTVMLHIGNKEYVVREG